VLPDGRQRPGVLAFAEGRLHFQPTGSTTALTLAELQAVRFSPAPSAPLLTARGHRILLPHGQGVTGQILSLDEQRLRLRTAWTDNLAIPRSAVSAVTQLPGWNTFFADDFDTDLKGWETTGSPALGGQRSPAGGHCLVLNRPAQSVSHPLTDPPEAGFFAVDFQAAAGVGGARWLVEGDFGPRTVRVVVAGDSDHYEVQMPGLEGTRFPLVRSPGWHRLRLDFAPERLAITIDDIALWYVEGQGPGGPLGRVRFVCIELPGTAAQSGEVAFAEVSLARPLTKVPHPPRDPTQDQVWLTTGDQLFGQVPHLDEQHVQLRARFGERTLPWGKVRGVFLRSTRPAPPPTEGERVRVSFWPGAGERLDQLDGVVHGLDDQNLLLEHVLLGTCKINRGRLRLLRVPMNPEMHEGELP
jgi:hypothetical protein